MNYTTFNPKPLQCMSVKLIVLPQDILFNILVVACPTLGFLVLALSHANKWCCYIDSGLQKFNPSSLCSC